MANEITVVASEVRPVHSQPHRMQVGTAVARGDAVIIDANGKVAPADAGDVAASAMAKGIVVGCGYAGSTATTAAAGQEVDVVFHGRVTLGSSAAMTEGQPVYVSEDNAGEMTQTAPATAGEFPYMIGYAFSAYEVFVQPQLAVPTAVSE